MFTNDTPTSQMHKVLLEFFPNKSFFESSKFFSLGGAGAGIVADSDPESEWRECVQKSKVFADAMEMIS